MLKQVFAFVIFMTVVVPQAHAGNWKAFNASVEKIAAAVDVGVSRDRYFELLANAAEKSRGICETMEQAKTAKNWYCMAFWQFRAAGTAWYGLDHPDKEQFEAAMKSIVFARRTGGPVEK